MNSKTNKKNKYKIKFLYSIINRDFNKSGTYLKKFSQYNNYKGYLVGGTPIELKEQKDLVMYVDNMKNVIKAILGDTLSKELIEKIDKGVENIRVPQTINSDDILNKIFESIYDNENNADNTDVNDVNDVNIVDLKNELKKIINETTKQSKEDEKATEAEAEAKRKVSKILGIDY